jgi:hypothetical protein
MTGNELEILVTVRGIVVPLTWAEDGSVTSVGISGFDERDFVISSELSLDHWVSLLRQKVEATGLITRTGIEPRTLKILDVHVL